jgi:hypothetical protein
MDPTLASFESSGIFFVDTPKNLLYTAPVGNEEEIHRIVDACQTLRNYPGIFERMRPSVIRCVEACIEYQGGHFELLL